MSDLCVAEDDSFGHGMAGCLEAPWGFVRVAFAVGKVEELTCGGWLVVMDDSASCYGGQPIALRLLVSFRALLGHPVHWLWHCTRCTRGTWDSRY